MIARRMLACLSLCSACLLSFLPATAAEPSQPRLVVVVSVDQFCQDYLIRFRDNFADAGLFHRVAQEGAAFTNCHHQHAFTITAPGHSVQMTGAYPSANGIIGNNWRDRYTGKDMYCVADPDVTVIGFSSGKGMSPKNLRVNTVGDVLKLATEGKGKVFGVAIKDRAAILMTGHLADSAFWLQDNYWVTSSYYRSDLPPYLRVLNEGKTIERFRGKKWELLLAKEKYHNQGPDANNFENPPKGFDAAFPHELPAAGVGNADQFGDAVLFTPYGNDLTLEAARAIVLGEQLGQDETPDILAINFSSNDYIGHAYGPYSLEVEDVTYRTDLQLGEFTRFLDEEVGPGRWTLALTADHGVCPIPEYAAERKLPAKRNPLGDLKQRKQELEARLRKVLEVPSDSNKPIVVELTGSQVMLDWDHPHMQGDRFALAQKATRDWLLAQPRVNFAMTRDDLLAGGEGRLQAQLQKAFNPHRSGDVLYVLDPYCITGGSGKGTTHGSPWHYDSHIPQLLLGCGIQRGQFSRKVSPAALASTVALLLGVDAPGGNVEQPLKEALK